jgi:hypothetical protein
LTKSHCFAEFFTSEEKIIKYTVYAGLYFEGLGDLQKAHELYAKAIEQKSDKD